MIDDIDPSEAAAAWMFEELRTHGVLDQFDAAHQIEKRFGSDVVYINDNGNSAIAKKVLTRFKKLHGGAAEWWNGEKRWVM